MKVILSLLQWRILRYIISGGTAAVANLSILFVLVHFLDVWYLISSVISYALAILVSFLMQKYFTFNDFTRDRIGKQGILHVGIQIFNLCLNTLLMYLLVDPAGVHYLLAQVISAGSIAVYSFFFYKHMVFAPAVVYNKTE
ncbi:MAG: hypothetical protein A3B99_00900 [Candidatus Yanofskybacteria bacterium RIFCSPHIGHO2_02_FULL_44_12b]|uniref:GtrA/DPMS transmembrane domain-containing protein n=2 Tax=Candidatus Zambryskiibacteriota TaxID=1817925 RepID=A0A1G2T1H2_9BACT|nr:MAG: hypothetical protein A3B99_00900 [Candidatus Yanofskybacteria bacterium RIFCSPHIGHO2_02_FULL_44_12b]OHA91136.1 MAG: hypothetical protein A2758_01510 [Candidatus Zambryskibacteria bacterium RIFCSPHIGHO2_01_FULL_49_18]OHB05174.1 MAG: hypothetical protein A3A26_02640 [Candidatus Zambryskibacteria bacterium RIFCSPLOWO2_01_FULL_47_14]